MKFQFEISKISCGKWNNKSGNFLVGYISPVGPNPCGPSALISNVLACLQHDSHGI